MLEVNKSTVANQVIVIGKSLNRTTNIRELIFAFMDI